MGGASEVHSKGPGAAQSGFLKTAGVCAVVYAVGLLVFFGVLGPTGIFTAKTMPDTLRLMADKHTVTIAGFWVFVVLPLPLAVAGLGCLAAFRPAGRITWLAALAFIGGSLLALLRNVLWLAVAQALAPAYASASAANQAALVTLGNTLHAYGFIMGDVLGGVLVGGIGVPLFSVAILRCHVAPRWIGWLGLAVGLIVGWGMFVVHLTKSLEGLLGLAMPLLVIWMVALGIALWRATEPVGEGGGALQPARS